MQEQISIQLFVENLSTLEVELRKEVPEARIFRSNAFSGEEIITVLISGTPLLFTLCVMVMRVFLKYRKKESTITIYIDKDAYEISGLSEKQMLKLLDSKNLEELQKNIRNESNRIEGN